MKESEGPHADGAYKITMLPINSSIRLPSVHTENLLTQKVHKNLTKNELFVNACELYVNLLKKMWTFCVLNVTFYWLLTHGAHFVHIKFIFAVVHIIYTSFSVHF